LLHAASTGNVTPFYGLADPEVGGLVFSLSLLVCFVKQSLSHRAAPRKLKGVTTVMLCGQHEATSTHTA
jgi:hypothetical protein